MKHCWCVYTLVHGGALSREKRIARITHRLRRQRDHLVVCKVGDHRSITPNKNCNQPTNDDAHAQNAATRPRGCVCGIILTIGHDDPVTFGRGRPKHGATHEEHYTGVEWYEMVVLDGLRCPPRYDPRQSTKEDSSVDYASEATNHGNGLCPCATSISLMNPHATTLVIACTTTIHLLSGTKRAEKHVQMFSAWVTVVYRLGTRSFDTIPRKRKKGTPPRPNLFSTLTLHLEEIPLVGGQRRGHIGDSGNRSFAVAT